MNILTENYLIFLEIEILTENYSDLFDKVYSDFRKEQSEFKTEIIEIEGVMPELSDCSASLTKEDIKNFEVELNVKIPAGMKNFYL